MGNREPRFLFFSSFLPGKIDFLLCKIPVLYLVPFCERIAKNWATNKGSSLTLSQEHAYELSFVF